MAKIARFQMPDGRVGRFEVPDESTPEQAQQLISDSLKPAAPIQAQDQPIQENPVSQGRALQSLPRSLAFGTQFQRSQSPEESAYNVGGKVVDATGSPLLGTLVRMAPDIAASLIGLPVGKLAAPLLESSAKTWMLRALNPTQTDMLAGKGARAAQTMLERGLSPTNEGVNTLRATGTELNAQTENLLRQTGGTVNKGAVASPISDVVAQIEKSNPIPQESRAAVEKVYDQFRMNKLVSDEIPVTQAQDLKQGIYRLMKDQYGQPGVDPAKVSAMKALGMGLRKEIENAVPGVKPLNAEASDVWNALNVAERRALMEAKKDVIGLSLLPHNPTAMLAVWANRNTAFKSALAKVLYKGQETIPATAGSISGIAASEAAQK